MSSPAIVQPQTGWNVDLFKAFWGRRDPSRPISLRGVVTDDIVGYWPRPIGVVKGLAPYQRVIEAVLAVSDDLVLTVPEHAASGEFTFLHWHATATLMGQRIDFHGCDRVRCQNGLVSENYIFCDHPYFEHVARRLADTA
jgi:hypothetical protein